jgi:hypothetical protein
MTVGEGCTLRMVENLREIFGSKGGEIVLKWRKLHNEELHNLLFL